MNPMGELLIEVVSALEATGIPYMLSGSLAASTYGLNRSTNDADFIIDPTPEQLDDLLERLKDDYITFAHAAREALQKRTMFSILKNQPFQKADLIPLKQDPFHQMEFSRRRRGKVLGHPAMILSPEDCILCKLDWSRQSESERQLSDVVTLLGTMDGRLEQDYVAHWAAELGVTKLFEKAKSELTRLRNKP